MPATTTPTPAEPTPPTPAEPAEAKAAPSIKVKVPQESGTITINTFDRKTPHRFDVSGGVIEAPDQAVADLLLARVDGASLAP